MVMGGLLTMSIQEALGLCGRHCQLLCPNTLALSTWLHVGLTSNCQCLHFFAFLLPPELTLPPVQQQARSATKHGNSHATSRWELVYKYPSSLTCKAG